MLPLVLSDEGLKQALCLGQHRAHMSERVMRAAKAHVKLHASAVLTDRQ